MIKGNRTTPSAVAFVVDSERLIGDVVKNQAAINPTNIIFDLNHGLPLEASFCSQVESELQVSSELDFKVSSELSSESIDFQESAIVMKFDLGFGGFWERRVRRKSVTRRVLIREMKALGECGVVVDSLEFLKQTHARETAKLVGLTDVMAETLAGIHENEKEGE
ncbi:glycoside hydrolase, family 79 [Tanacetum coccineum]